MFSWRAYREYCADNPRGYWFKRKLYGWGWTPVRREGWVVVGVYVAVVLLLAVRVPESATFSELVWPFFVPFVSSTVALVVLSYSKGESPRWQWGLPKTENKSNHEDEGGL